MTTNPTYGELQGRVTELEVEVDYYRKRKDGAYTERNKVVYALAKAAISAGFHAGIRQHEPDPDPTWDPEWLTIVTIDLPTGQCAWHIHDSHKPIFADLPAYTTPYDGHDTEEKYRRLLAFEGFPTDDAHLTLNDRFSKVWWAWMNYVASVGDSMPTAKLDALYDNAIKVTGENLPDPEPNRFLPYEIVVKWSKKDKSFVARVPALNVAAHGDSASAAVREAIVAGTAVLDTMRAHGDPIPGGA